MAEIGTDLLSKVAAGAFTYPGIMHASDTDESEFDRHFRQRARGQKTVLVVSALLTLAFGALAMRALIINTDWRTVLGVELFLRMLLAVFAMPLGLILYAPGYLIARRRSSSRSRAWWLGLALPALAAVGVVGWGVLDRVFPGRLFEKFSGRALPPSARVIDHAYDGTVLEDEFSITFEAPVSEIRDLLQEFRVTPTQTHGVESFPGVPVHGDNGSLEIDWDKGLVVFEYLCV